MKRKYELMFTLDALLDDAAVEEAANKIRSGLEARGAEILDWNRWGKRRFAYEIKGRTHGVYVVVTMMMEPKETAEVELMLKLNDAVLRHLLLSISPRMEKLIAKQNALRSKLATEVSERAAKAETANNPADERPQSLEEAEAEAEKLTADNAN